MNRLWKFDRLSVILFFLCRQTTAYEMRIGDWSSDVCASDLFAAARLFLVRSSHNLTFSCPLPTPFPNRSRETIMAGAQNETLLTLTADIVAAHVSNNNVAVSDLATTIERVQIGRASCRERVCQYV